MRTVLDASAAVGLLARLPTAAKVASAIGTDRMLVPAHFDAEVCSALRRLHLAAVISRDERDRAITRLARFPAERIPLPPLLALTVGYLGSLTAHDALYLSCVTYTRADRLLTSDRRLAASHDIDVPVTIV